MNRLDPPRMKSLNSFPVSGRNSSAKDLMETQTALEDIRKTMNDFGSNVAQVKLLISNEFDYVILNITSNTFFPYCTF